MGRYLIVANQTVGGGRLEDALRERIKQDDQFHVVVPTTRSQDEASGWGDDGESRSIEQARHRAEHRLSRLVDTIQSMGARADGEVGDADPAVAVKDVLQSTYFDEVIISTLPSGISRWLKMDLPSRVSRMTKAKVTTIEAEG